MNSTHVLIAYLILVSPLASHAQSPELKVLQVEYDNQLSERVTEAYNAGLAKLDAGYLAGIDRVLASSKAAGDLEGALALEAEKKRVAAKEPLPANDDQAAKALKSLRGIYRLELTKLEAQRATNTAALLTPYVGKLKQLEADLTKADRLTDAKAVMDYRQGIAAGVPMKANVAGVPSTPSVTNTPSAPPPPIGAFGKGGFTNTLGMKFMPVEGTNVHFCIFPTRVKDYDAYDTDAAGVDGSWKTQQHMGVPVSKEPDYPVVGVSWGDAKGFCDWLSKKEGRTYRLPTDREWSVANGIASSEKVKSDSTPESLHNKIMDVYHWGTKWPPPKGVANYADTSLKQKFPKENVIHDAYTDGFPLTSPVMSFKPNKFGLYDMGGNVWQWCEDWWNGEQKARIMRGGCWFGSDRWSLHSSYRNNRQAPTSRTNHTGFRIVVERSAP